MTVMFVQMSMLQKRKQRLLQGNERRPRHGTFLLVKCIASIVIRLLLKAQHQCRCHTWRFCVVCSTGVSEEAVSWKVLRVDCEDVFSPPRTRRLKGDDAHKLDGSKAIHSQRKGDRQRYYQCCKQSKQGCEGPVNV